MILGIETFTNKSQHAAVSVGFDVGDSIDIAAQLLHPPILTDLVRVADVEFHMIVREAFSDLV